MPYARMADAVVSVHFLWILFLLFGSWWGRHYRWVGRVHIAALVLAFLVEVFNWYCPLTHLEVWFREKGAQAGYHESFITHYLDSLIYIEISRTPIVILTILICLGNFWLYWSAWRR